MKKNQTFDYADTDICISEMGTKWMSSQKKCKSQKHRSKKTMLDNQTYPIVYINELHIHVENMPDKPNDQIIKLNDWRETENEN